MVGLVGESPGAEGKDGQPTGGANLDWWLTTWLNEAAERCAVIGGGHRMRHRLRWAVPKAVLGTGCVKEW